MAIYSIDTSDALRVVAVKDAGNVAKERVLCRATAAVELVRFALINARGNAGRVRDLNRNVFWFPETEVRAGDIVRVHTRVGKPGVQLGVWRGKATRYHDFYWDRVRPVWIGPSNTVVLFEIAAWHMFEIPQRG